MDVSVNHSTISIGFFREGRRKYFLSSFKGEPLRLPLNGSKVISSVFDFKIFN